MRYGRHVNMDLWGTPAKEDKWLWGYIAMALLGGCPVADLVSSFMKKKILLMRM